MKNKIFFLALILILSGIKENSFAQNYLSLFGDTSTTWDVVLFGACDAVCSGTISVMGDTIINANTYKMISGLSGFVREDTTQGKAWYYDMNNNTEYLVMDLSLNVSDTFYIYDITSVATIFHVDSVYYVSGKKYVRLDAWTSICALNEKITFIEGSGTTAGFSYQRELNGSVASSMLCHHKNGVKVAGNILFNDSCSYCFVGISEINSDENFTKVFPNPVIDELSIETKNTPFNDFYLAIYNMLGERIILQKIINKLTTINVSNLAKGVYIVGDNFSNKYQRLIKQ